MLNDPTSSPFTIQASGDKCVIFSIEEKQTVVCGLWDWPMECGEVYCSDVMSFPEEFNGTKGIIHPEDFTSVAQALQLSPIPDVPRFQFRIITTYGEIKTLTGFRLTVKETPQFGNDLITALWNKAVRERAMQHQLDFLSAQVSLSENSERCFDTGTWFISKSTGTGWYSDNVFKIYGVPPQSLNANVNTFTGPIHPDDKPTVVAAYEKAYLEEIPIHLRFRILRPDQSVKHVEHLTYWSNRTDGHRIFNGLVRDVTSEVAMEKELVSAILRENLLSRTVSFNEQHQGAAHCFVNLATRQFRFSENFGRLLGIRDPNKISYNTFLEAVLPEDRESLQRRMDGMFLHHSVPEMEFRVLRHDGRIRHIRQTAKLLGLPDNELVMALCQQDITTTVSLEHKIKEHEENEELLSFLLEGQETFSDVSHVIWFPDGSMKWSQSFYRLLGFKSITTEPSAKILLSSIHEDDLQDFREAITLVENGQSHHDTRIRMKSVRGKSDMHVSFRRFEVSAGHAVVGLFRNLTADIQQQQRLVEKEMLVKRLANILGNCLIVTDLENRITAWNECTEISTGIQADHALHQNLFEVLPQLRETSFNAQLNAALAGSELKIDQAEKGYLSRFHSYSLSPVLDSSERQTGVLHVIRDISKEKELELQAMQQSQLMSKLVERYPASVVVLDTEFNVLNLNAHAQAYLNIPQFGSTGRNLLELIPSFINHPVYRHLRRVVSGDTVELAGLLNETSGEFVDCHLIPVRTDQRKVCCILWITERSGMLNEWPVKLLSGN